MHEVMDATIGRLLSPFHTDQFDSVKDQFASLVCQMLAEGKPVYLAVDLPAVDRKGNTAVVEPVRKIDDQLCKPVVDKVHPVRVLHDYLNFVYYFRDKFECLLISDKLIADWTMDHPVLLRQQEFGALILPHYGRILHCLMFAAAKQGNLV